MDWRVSARGPARPSRRRPPGAPACPLPTSPLKGGGEKTARPASLFGHRERSPTGGLTPPPWAWGTLPTSLSPGGERAASVFFSSPLQGEVGRALPGEGSLYRPGIACSMQPPPDWPQIRGALRRPAAAMSGTTRRRGEVIPRNLFRGLAGARARAAPPARKPQPRQALGRPRPAGNRKLSLGPWSGLRAAPGAASFAEAGKGACHGQEIAARGSSDRGAPWPQGFRRAPCFQWLVPSRCGSRRGFRGVFGPFRPVPVRDSPG